MAEIFPFHNAVNHAMLEKVLGSLKPLRQFGPDRFFNHSWPGKSDHGLGLGKDDISQHGDACGDATRGGIGQHGDVGNPRLLESGKGRARLGHLHEREDSLLHSCPSGGAEDHDADSLLNSPFNQAGDLFPHRGSKTPTQEIKFQDAEQDGLALDLRLSADDGLFLSGRFLGFLDSYRITLGILELQRVRGNNVTVQFMKVFGSTRDSIRFRAGIGK